MGLTNVLLFDSLLNLTLYLPDSQQYQQYLTEHKYGDIPGFLSKKS